MQTQQFNAHKVCARTHGSVLVRPVPRCSQAPRGCVAAKARLEALVFDCDGVILESEELHRQAYNAAFKHFDAKIGGKPVVWDVHFYDQLNNRLSGGIPKMKCFFNEVAAAWPTTTILGGRTPATAAEQQQVVEIFQEWKGEEYRRLMGSGAVPARPGVLRLMDEARSAGLKLAVCSAATKSSCLFTLRCLLGQQRLDRLDCFLAGDDVEKRKPHPMIYQMAASRMGVEPANCIVIEDTNTGLKAAAAAGMRVIITTTPTTKDLAFPGAALVVPDLGEVPRPMVTLSDLQAIVALEPAKVEA